MNSTLLTIIIILVIGIVLGVWIATTLQKKGQRTAAEKIGEGLSAVNAEKMQKKRENKKKILELLGKQDKISNNDVQNLLGVSDASASNYLQELESEGKIEQVGDEGRGVFYRLK